jgi:hypothetical protein
MMVLIGVLLLGWRALVGPYRAQRAAMAAIEEAGGSYTTELGGPAWLRRFAGDWFQEIVSADLGSGDVDRRTLSRVLALHSVRTLRLRGPEFDDTDLERLRSRRALQRLTLARTSATRAAVDEFQRQRQDSEVLIELNFSELLPQEAADCVRLAAWGAAADDRKFTPPPAARQWVGRKVRITGHFWRTWDDDPDPISRSTTRLGHLRTRPSVGWNDIIPPKYDDIAVSFTTPVEKRRLTASTFVDVEGVWIVHIDGPSGQVEYRLQEAALVAK